MAEAASVVNFRVAMVYFEKDVEPALCHAAGRISDKKDQEKSRGAPWHLSEGAVQFRVPWLLWDDVQRAFVPGRTMGPLSPQH